MGELIAHALAAAAQAFLEVVCYFTAKVLLQPLSFGYLRVLEPSPGRPAGWWGEPAFRRLPRGRIGIQADVAAIMGLLIWVAVVAAGVLLYLNRSS